ncbi:hypothetical protein ACT21L_000117 [Vibrio vulnificus]|nr:hypothetical protein [Vibrio vulnificus]ELI3521932.1 hypothetical protein [Vibrio vulnificus]
MQTSTANLGGVYPFFDLLKLETQHKPNVDFVILDMDSGPSINIRDNSNTDNLESGIDDTKLDEIYQDVTNDLLGYYLDGSHTNYDLKPHVEHANELGMDSIKVLYTLGVNAKGYLDYIDVSCDSAPSIDTQMGHFPSSEPRIITTNTPDGHNTFQVNTKEYSGDPHQLLFCYSQKSESRSSRLELIPNETVKGRFLNEPELKVVSAFVSRNLSYIKKANGGVKLVLRDYRSDEVALARWYLKSRNQLHTHNEVVINGNNYKFHLGE